MGSPCRSIMYDSRGAKRSARALIVAWSAVRPAGVRAPTPATAMSQLVAEEVMAPSPEQPLLEHLDLAELLVLRGEGHARAERQLDPHRVGVDQDRLQVRPVLAPLRAEEAGEPRGHARELEPPGSVGRGAE